MDESDSIPLSPNGSSDTLNSLLERLCHALDPSE